MAEQYTHYSKETGTRPVIIITIIKIKIMQKIIAGIDEAGRGPLAGPVCAGCVILDPTKPIIGLKDSKQLSAKRRETLYEQIERDALCWSLGFASVAEIEQLNILQATLLAMKRAFDQLKIQPDLVLVDGKDIPQIPGNVKAEIDGDNRIAEISAASIMAKVTRDRMMIELDYEYPQYGFAEHKGYGTKKHLEVLKKFGPSCHHRRSFAPVNVLLQGVAK